MCPGARGRLRPDNYEANGHDLGQAFGCVNANSVAAAFVVGFFLPGAAATIGVSVKSAFGAATSEDVVSTVTGFIVGSGLKRGITKGLDDANGPAQANACGCNKGNSGFASALHNFLY